MALPTCECIASFTQAAKLDAIYCTLLAISEGGGDITLPLVPSQGGTGVANADAETITLNGGFALALTLTGATGLTLPTTGTLATTAQLPDQALNQASSPTFSALTVSGAIDNTGGGITTANLIFTTVGGGADTPVADGTYTVGIGGTQNGTITTINGVITVIQEAQP